MYTHILWDFNGTIFDDVDTGLKCANALLRNRNMKQLTSLEEYHNAFCFPIIKYYENLGFDFTKLSYDELAHEWMKEYLECSKSSKLFDGIIEIFELIKGKNIPQTILSATEKTMLINQLKDFNIYSYFDEVLGLDNIYAHSKVDIAREWKNRVNPISAVLIGDTVHDYEVSKEIGVDCILIAAGHQSRKALLQCGVRVLDNVKEVIEII